MKYNEGAVGAYLVAGVARLRPELIAVRSGMKGRPISAHLALSDLGEPTRVNRHVFDHFGGHTKLEAF